jgi:hypothetical protein
VNEAPEKIVEVSIAIVQIDNDTTCAWNLFTLLLYL